VFRFDATGALFAEVWSAGTAIASSNITAVAGCTPTAAVPNPFYFSYRTGLTQFGCGSNPNAFITTSNPANEVLPVSAYSIAGLSNPGSAATMTMTGLSLSSQSGCSVKAAGQAPTINDSGCVVTISPNSPGLVVGTSGIPSADVVTVQAPITLGSAGFPAASTPISGNATGTTGAVVGTLAANATKTTYICGFNVQAIGGTAAVGPITVAGLIGSSQVYQASSTAAGGQAASANFQPCVPSSAINTAITVTTTADGTATAVDVNSWGFQQ